MLKKSFFLFISSIFLIACDQNTRPASAPTQSAPAPAQTSSAYTTVDPATAGSIHGTIHLTGNAPAPVKIDMGQDPACQFASSQPNMSQQFVVNHGNLANVYVYVKSGLEGKSFAVPLQPVVLDQKGCRYEPHVLAMMAGQTLKIENSDPTMHNVHPSPKAPSNQEWNVSQMPKGEPVEKSFHDPEVMMPIQCNQHPWMKAFLNVAPNPFYAISDAEGNFKIQGLPPGDYTIAAVHEKLGEQTQKISVGPKQNAEANFTFAVR
jgi:plastocyanin